MTEEWLLNLKKRSVEPESQVRVFPKSLVIERAGTHTCRTYPTLGVLTPIGGAMKELGTAKTVTTSVTTSLTTAVIALSFIAFSSTQSAVADTPHQSLHMAGRALTDVANTIRNGRGAPVASLGNDGDFYIDLLTYNFYGPKTNSHWGVPTSLKGPSGAVGTSGVAGASSAANSAIQKAGATGPQGIQGVQGVPGPQGIQGAPGDVGATGSAGAVGATGPAGANGLPGGSGASGAQGVAGLSGAQGPVGLTGATGLTGAIGPIGITGANGATGAQGLTGATGPAGAAGAQGATGATGTPGAIGPSQVQAISLQPWTLASKTPDTTSTSSPFANLAPGMSYQFVMIVTATFAVSQPVNNGFQLGLKLSSTDLIANPTYVVASSPGYFVDGLISTSRYSFTVVGTFTASSTSSGDSFLLTAVDATGASGFNSLSFSGEAEIQLVGSITN